MSAEYLTSLLKKAFELGVDAGRHDQIARGQRREPIDMNIRWQEVYRDLLRASEGQTP